MNPASHHRRSIRLPNYDYTLPGAYFVTICTWQRECILGEVVNNTIKLTQIGQIIKSEWETLPYQFPFIHLDSYVIMPNHLHGIIIINQRVGATRTTPKDPLSGKRTSPTATLVGDGGSPLQKAINGQTQPKGPESGSLGAIIGQFKSQATKRIWKISSYVHIPIWQRNYYEHIIRDEADWENAIAYIQSNPSRWAEDRFCS